jgi:hypothetical protein
MAGKPKNDMASSQRLKFINSAQHLECDEDEAAFDERLRQISKSPPKPAKKDKDKAPE